MGPNCTERENRAWAQTMKLASRISRRPRRHIETITVKDDYL